MLSVLGPRIKKRSSPHLPTECKHVVVLKEVDGRMRLQAVQPTSHTLRNVMLMDVCKVLNH